MISAMFCATRVTLVPTFVLGSLRLLRLLVVLTTSLIGRYSMRSMIATSSTFRGRPTKWIRWMLWGASLCVVLAAGCASRSSVTTGNPANNDAAAAIADYHLLLIVELGPTGARIVTARTVQQPFSASKSEPNPDSSWRVDVVDKYGQVLYSRNIPPADEMRAEVAGPDGRIEALHTRKVVSALDPRIPPIPNAASITFWDNRPGSSSLISKGLLGSVPYPTDLP
jgi:hypothetical protein